MILLELLCLNLKSIKHPMCLFCSVIQVINYLYVTHVPPTLDVIEKLKEINILILIYFYYL